MATEHFTTIIAFISILKIIFCFLKYNCDVPTSEQYFEYGAKHPMEPICSENFFGDKLLDENMISSWWYFWTHALTLGLYNYIVLLYLLFTTQRVSGTLNSVRSEYADGDGQSGQTAPRARLNYNDCLTWYAK